MDDISFKKILEFFNLSWTGYRKVRKGVKKRITRRMQELECRSVEKYLGILQKEPEEMHRVKELLGVPISRFFRDRELWRVMGKSVIPDLIQACGARKIRVWSAGCARGEEAYSLRMLWDDFSEHRKGIPSLEILATDINPEVIEKARSGIYQISSLREVSSSFLEKYFIRVGSKYLLREKLKEDIKWMIHDLLRDDPPQKDFDLIFLRNSLLTYYEDSIKIPALRRVVNALRPGGYLIIGNNEQVPVKFTSLERYWQYRCIYVKQ